MRAFAAGAALGLAVALSACGLTRGLAVASPEVENGSTQDHPPEVTRIMVRMRNGSLNYSVDVDAKGRATRCVVTRSSGSPEIDAEICTELRDRTRYTPARDRQGRPVPGVFAREYSWHNFHE